MTHKNFYDFERGLSEGKASKLSRPYLSDVYIAEFRRGSMKTYYKLYNDDSFKDAEFLKRNVKKSITIMPRQQQQERGIKSKKKETILKNWSSLMPVNRRAFFENRPINGTSVDLAYESE